MTKPKDKKPKKHDDEAPDAKPTPVDRPTPHVETAPPPAHDAPVILGGVCPVCGTDRVGLMPSVPCPVDGYRAVEA